MFAAIAIAGCALTAAAQDKGSFTPMPLDSGFGRIDLSDPPVPPEQIIKEFSAKETEFHEALDHYTYRRDARVQVIDDDTGKVKGEWYEVDDVIFDPSGRRTEKVVFAPASTLEQAGIMMSPSDLQDIQHGYPFVLTTADLPEYDIKYGGRQQVDDVNCYVFDVSPKTIEKGKRYLDGRIWVDSTDLQIVVTDGRMVPDDTKKNQEDLHPPFMTWRQQVDGHYWFPVYTKGRRNAALQRRLRLHGAGCAHPRRHQIHRLQTVRVIEQGVLQRARSQQRRDPAESGAKCPA